MDKDALCIKTCSGLIKDTAEQPSEHRTYIERTSGVQKTSWKPSELLIYVTFTSCDQGVASSALFLYNSEQVFVYIIYTVAHSEPCQTIKVERFEKMVNGLIISAKRSILDVCQGSDKPLEYVL